MAQGKKKTTTEFINDAMNIHGDRYDYSLVNYKNAKAKIKIKCSVHGIFIQRPDVHLRGDGCKECRNDSFRKTTNQFIQEAIRIHGDKYDYSLVKYITNRIKVKIICKHHGLFSQEPFWHLQGSDCPECKPNVSKLETQWLDYMNIPNDSEHRQVKIGKYFVDGYDPDTNTVYEFWGDYWHGNPDTTDHSKINSTNKKTFRELYENTIKKEKLIRDSGYNLVTIWESDWKKCA